MEIARKITAARNLLDWTISDLSKRTGITSSAISKIENGGEMRVETNKKILNAFEYEGIVFLDDGVRLPYFSTKSLGENWFKDVLKDIHTELTKLPLSSREVLIYGTNDEKTPVDTIEYIRFLKEQGITFREMLQEGDTFILGEVSSYRWINKDNYMNFITVIYADKVILDLGGNALLIKNKNYADCERCKFNEVWDKSAPLDVESTANVRY